MPLSFQPSFISTGETRVLLGLLALLVATVLFPQPGLAQDIDQAELKRAFFKPLNEDQKVSLLRELDRSKQLTSVQLGAKYRWGYIPPDRRPPVSLARWWDGLNARQRRKERLEWFNNHFQQLNVERAARELGLRDRLSQLYRQLGQEESNEGLALENVSFPRGSLKLDTSTAQTLPEGYERFQYGTPDAEQPATTDRPKPVDPTAAPEKEASPTPEKTVGDPESSSAPTPSSSAEPADTSPDTTTESDTTPEWNRTLQFDGGTVIFQRVGDEIQATRRRTTPDTHLRTRPNYNYPVRDAESGEEMELPRLRYDGEQISPKLRYRTPAGPQPGAR